MGRIQIGGSGGGNLGKFRGHWEISSRWLWIIVDAHCFMRMKDVTDEDEGTRRMNRRRGKEKGRRSRDEIEGTGRWRKETSA